MTTQNSYNITNSFLTNLLNIKITNFQHNIKRFRTLYIYIRFSTQKKGNYYLSFSLPLLTSSISAEEPPKNSSQLFMPSLSLRLGHSYTFIIYSQSFSHLPHTFTIHYSPISFTFILSSSLNHQHAPFSKIFTLFILHSQLHKHHFLTNLNPSELISQNSLTLLYLHLWTSHAPSHRNNTDLACLSSQIFIILKAHNKNPITQHQHAHKEVTEKRIKRKEKLK